MEKLFTETKRLYAQIREFADIDLIYRNKARLEETIELKKRMFEDAPDRQAYRAIQEEIDELIEDVQDCERSIKIAKKQRNGFYRDNEAKQIVTAYNKEAAPLIKQYEKLNKQLSQAVQAFLGAVDDATKEMMGIEKAMVGMFEITNKLPSEHSKHLSKLPVKNMILTHNTSLIKKAPNTHTEFLRVVSKDLEEKGFTKL